MPKVTFSNAKGILQEAGTGFQVNDAPILMESESVAGNAVITITPNVTDSGDGDAAIDFTGKYFKIATSEEEWYVWFDGGVAGTDDPAPGDLDASNSIRISDAIGDLDDVAKTCNAIVARLNAAVAGASNYSATSLADDGATTICDLVLGPADSDTSGTADKASLGADDVSDRFAASTDGSTVTVAVLPIGAVTASSRSVSEGDLHDQTTVDPGVTTASDDDWSVTFTDGSGDNGSALQAFGTSVISNAGSEVCTATLANAAAGAKKLIAQSGAGAIDVTFNNNAGTSVTASFDDDGESLYLISTGLGWGVLLNTGSIAIA